MDLETVRADAKKKSARQQKACCCFVLFLVTSCSGKLFQFPPSTTKTKGESTPLQSHIRGLPAGKETWVIVPLQRSSRGVPKMNGTLRNLSSEVVNFQFDIVFYDFKCSE